ncbi:hypothetical protein AG1IA_07621 [Rhizoctonia solani AG-1 IA]|uniref:Uncharacterized protein n=1 Tax=Thanatephorus cucumeris (strain AG1-IA) TaxID=983506 RepID=L8WNM4_THACA|nr:hypothetical protein AG1IA_07621 [Rhizoctonia solani AG-1 IA]
MGSTNDPENGQAVGSTCYAAAVIYAAMIAFCGCQIGLHKRKARGGDIFLDTDMGICGLAYAECCMFEERAHDWCSYSMCWACPLHNCSQCCCGPRNTPVIVFLWLFAQEWT